MKVFYLTLILLTSLINITFGQNEIQAFGKIDIADLEMKECAFEKDANAMVLFDKADVYFDHNFDIVMERHKRIKIFNDKARKEADITLEYYGGYQLEYLTNLQAQTINLQNGKPAITKVDKKSIFNQIIDKSRNKMVFTFPDVQDGSVLEFKYTLRTVAVWNFPDWAFQGRLPVRYSEIKTSIPEYFYYKTQIRTRQPFVKNTTKAENSSIGSGANVLTYALENTTRALSNIPSLRDEPFMSSRADNLQQIVFQLNMIKPVYGFTQTAADTWPKVGKVLVDHEDFGKQFKRKLKDEELILARARTYQKDDDKIAYIFNEVKNAMKWDDIDSRYTNVGTVRAWEKKTGNSTEINLILYHLLKEAGLKAYPMVVSTREHGKVYVAYPSTSNFNRTVTYIPIDSTKKYILDATDKLNSYNEIPRELLNSTGLYVDKDNEKYDLIPITLEEPSRQVVVLAAQVNPDGTMEGNANISSYRYHKLKYRQAYNKNEVDKYKDFLREDNNSLKILDVKVENLEVDTLPLKQDIKFNLELTGSDNNYIYIQPNQFTSLRNNPFLSETRATDIDFGFKNSFIITGNYKLPEGFKIDAMPKSASMGMPDNSISFRRVVGEQDGQVVIRFSIDYKKPILFKEDYDVIREFYQKMYEMLNEPIVLKKI